MIQIQRREQFEHAAARLTKEPQSIRRHEARLYIVTNKTKGHSYPVRIERLNGKTFATCGCEAGTPHHGNRRPVVCKHVAALIIFLRAVRVMRRRTSH
ncbi:MAG: hypothetical protein WCD76_02615 [Pyrinomonadaceae bacterium]